MRRDAWGVTKSVLCSFRIKGGMMTNVYTDQLAALPLSEVYIRFSANGMYVAAISLEGRVLNIFENEGMPLQRPSLSAMRQYLLHCGCPPNTFVIEDDGAESQADRFLPPQNFALAAM
jgi:hypothetical protein